MKFQALVSIVALTVGLMSSGTALAAKPAMKGYGLATSALTAKKGSAITPKGTMFCADASKNATALCSRAGFSDNDRFSRRM